MLSRLATTFLQNSKQTGKQTLTVLHQFLLFFFCFWLISYTSCFLIQLLILLISMLGGITREVGGFTAYSRSRKRESRPSSLSVKAK